MAAGVQKAWSATASSNANSDSNINFAEGQAPSTVNDSARAVMAGVKAFANQIGGAKTSAGSSNAYTFTSDSAGAISTAYAAGMIFRFKADKTNTGAATFNADGVGAVDIRKGGGQTALVAGDIVQNGIYDVSHNGTYFILLNPETGQGATGFQAADATLTALAALTIADNTLIRGTGADALETIVSTPVAQHVSTITGAVATGTTLIPTDDTIPQITEGTEFMTLAITPKNANNVLVIRVVFNFSISVAANGHVALFQDATASALAAGSKSDPGGTFNQVEFVHRMVAGTTSSTTFRVRAGPGGVSTMTFNGIGGARFLGGVGVSSIDITELWA